MRRYEVYRQGKVICYVQQTENRVAMVTQANNDRRREDSFVCKTRESANRLYRAIQAMMEALHVCVD